VKRHLAPAAPILILLAGTVAAAQVPPRARDLAAGKFLVAQKGLLDPNFIQTVVLLAKYGEDGAMGLIINRRTKLPLSKVLGDLPEAKDRSDPVFMGGPVAITGVLGLARSREKPGDAQPIFADVYLVSSKEQLQKALAASGGPGVFRAYLGYSGWAPGQLEYEVEAGSWFILRGDAGTAFDPDPETVWSRMMKKTEVRIAAAPRFGLRTTGP
jgi:putative transcriptional regulator